VNVILEWTRERQAAVDTHIVLDWNDSSNLAYECLDLVLRKKSSRMILRLHVIVPNVGILLVGTIRAGLVTLQPEPERELLISRQRRWSSLGMLQPRQDILGDGEFVQLCITHGLVKSSRPVEVLNRRLPIIVILMKERCVGVFFLVVFLLWFIFDKRGPGRRARRWCLRSRGWDWRPRMRRCRSIGSI
jgi:hypothetical protein